MSEHIEGHNHLPQGRHDTASQKCEYCNCDINDHIADAKFGVVQKIYNSSGKEMRPNPLKSD